MFRLPNVSGRIFDMIEDRDGNLVNSFFFIKSTSDDKSFTQIQVIEKGGDLVVNFVSDKYDAEYYSEKYLPEFSKRFKRSIKVVVNDEIFVKKNGKAPIYMNLDKV